LHSCIAITATAISLAATAFHSWPDCHAATAAASHYISH